MQKKIIVYENKFPTIREILLVTLLVRLIKRQYMKGVCSSFWAQ